jgi:hypothetical protein
MKCAIAPPRRNAGLSTLFVRRTPQRTSRIVIGRVLPPDPTLGTPTGSGNASEYRAFPLGSCPESAASGGYGAVCSRVARQSLDATRLSFVCSDELGRRQDMLFDRPLQLSLVRTSARVNGGVEGVEAEDVAVTSMAGWRARPAVAARAEVVPPLHWRGLAFAEPAGTRVESPRDPVRENAPRRVRIVHDQRQRTRFLGNVLPGQRRREILAVARVLARDRLRMPEGAALERELRHQQASRRALRAELGRRYLEKRPRPK